MNVWQVVWVDIFTLLQYMSICLSVCWHVTLSHSSCVCFSCSVRYLESVIFKLIVTLTFSKCSSDWAWSDAENVLTGTFTDGLCMWIKNLLIVSWCGTVLTICMNCCCVSDANEHPRALLGRRNSSLKFRQVTQNDVLVVQCNASNTHGYIFANAFLNVLG